MTILTQFGTHRAQHSDLGTLRAIAETTKPLLRKAVAYIRPILEAAAEMHHERGMSEKAVKLRCEEYVRALERRSIGPMFDVEGFLEPRTAGPIIVHLARLMTDFPPPTFTLLGGEDENGEQLGDRLIAFGDPSEDEHGFQQAQYERVFEAQAHFMLAHRGPSGFKASKDTRPTRCPFMSTCNHGLKKLDPNSCANHPWRHISNPQTEYSGCWYTGGVAGVLSTVEFSRVDRDRTEDTEAHDP